MVVNTIKLLLLILDALKILPDRGINNYIKFF